MNKSSVLVVEDDLNLREALCDTLELQNFQVLQAESGEQALEILVKSSVDLLVSDVNMAGMDGHELLQRVRSEYPFVPVLLITAYGSISKSVSAMQNGAVDYLVKPFKPEEFVDTVRKHIGAPVENSNSLPIAEEQSSKDLLKLAQKVAASDATVLLSGESGTGKEVLAKYIHDQSSRAGNIFLAINCAAIPENMLEATLFGHEKGAFTGAYAASPGKFEQADGGTLLLDEISEMDIGLQAKILRVLQEREVERVGGRKILKLDVRVIATTNKDLKKCVEEGRFREDLYYRLSVFPLKWLPLRQRKKDILPIARKLLRHHGRLANRPSLTLDASAENLLLDYPWPGNVRELDNVIQRALIIHSGAEITSAHLSLDNVALCSSGTGMDVSTESALDKATIGDDESQPGGFGALGSDLKQREFEVILNTLKQQGGKRKETAEILGISARTLRYKIARIRESGISIESVLSAW